MKKFAIGIVVGVVATLVWGTWSIGRELDDFPPFYGE